MREIETISSTVNLTVSFSVNYQERAIENFAKTQRSGQ
jgi:hypothetical protein